MATLALVAACGAKQPEADPTKVTQLAKTMVDNAPSPASVANCTPADLTSGIQLTQRALIQLAGEPMADVPERAAWINPTELDAPAVTTLLNASASKTARRRAAATVLAAPAIVVYRVEMVNVPLALMVKELKRGALGMRAVRYERGVPTCLLVFTVQNDKAKSEWAMDKSDRATVDPAVAEALRDDLRVQLLAKIAALKTATP